MTKRTILYLFPIIMILLLNLSCSESKDTARYLENSNIKNEVVEKNTQNSNVIPVPEKEEITDIDNVEKVSIPSQYTDFIKYRDSDDSIMFYAKEDIDLDGNDEIIIAVGYSDLIYQVYLMRDNKGKIEQLTEDLHENGYNIYEVKLIRLQNMPKRYIYCGLTNTASLLGFEIYELSDNQAKLICYSASATGAGEDELKDFDNDGQYDGYVQDRWSYDVMNYSVCATYLWENNSFVLSNTDVGIPEYPDNIKEILIQYLSLRALGVEKSSEVEKRLAELCLYDKANEIDVPFYFADDQLEFSIQENNNTATATVSFTESDLNKERTYTFHLVKSSSRWCIDKMEAKKNEGK